MKRISKVLSMFLVVVMCFGLFSTSAFATSMAHFDFSGGNNAAENTNTAGGGFDFNPVGSSGSQSNSNSSFDFGEPSQPASVEPQQQATTSEPTLSIQDTPMLGAPAPSSSDTTQWTFVAEKTTVSKSMSDTEATVKIKATGAGASGFDSDSFSGFRYDTSPEGLNMKEMKQGEHYSISANALVLYGSWLKSLPVGVYYFFGMRTNDTPQRLAYISVNSGSFGPFSMVSTYNKNAANPTPISASAAGQMNLFSGFGIVGVTDSSYKKVLEANTHYDSNADSMTIRTSFLNTLADGTYKLVGFTTPSDFNKDQVVIGEFVIESKPVDLGEIGLRNPSYDKSDANRTSNTVYAHFNNGAALSMVTDVSISGPTSKTLANNTEYYVDNAHNNIVIRPAFLDTLADGSYDFNISYTSGLASGQKKIGTFIVSTGNPDSEFTIGNNPYDKSAAKRSAIVALAGGNHPLDAVNSVTGVAISGTESRTLASSEYYKVTNNPYYVAIRPEVLDTLPEGTYNFILTVKTGAASTQINAGQFTVKASAVDAEFTIANSPYDKNSTDRKAVTRLVSSPVACTSRYASGSVSIFWNASLRRSRTVRYVMRLFRMLMPHCSAAVNTTATPIFRRIRKSASNSTLSFPMMRSTASPVSTGTYSVSATTAAAISSDTRTAPL